MKFVYRDVAITCVVGAVPRNVARFDDEIANYSHDPANSLKLKKLMGYGEHRIEDQQRTVSDYACLMFERLASQGKVVPADVGAVIVVTQTPDYPIPPTSCVIHGRLGLDESAYCLDITDGCTGYVKALNEACMLLQATEARYVLVLAGDILSPKVSRRDRNSYPLIGDAVTLTVVSRQAGHAPTLIQLRTRGADYDKLIIRAGGLRLPATDETREMQVDEDGNFRSLEHLHMQGRDVFAFTQTVVPDFVLANVAGEPQALDRYERLYFHQANAFIIDRLRQKFSADATRMPDRVIRRYGNSSSATIPMLLASEEEGKNMRCLLVGFGVGLQWGLADMEIDTRVCQGVMEV